MIPFVLSTIFFSNKLKPKKKFSNEKFVQPYWKFDGADFIAIRKSSAFSSSMILIHTDNNNLHTRISPTKKEAAPHHDLRVQWLQKKTINHQSTFKLLSVVKIGAILCLKFCVASVYK